MASAPLDSVVILNYHKALKQCLQRSIEQSAHCTWKNPGTSAETYFGSSNVDVERQCHANLADLIGEPRKPSLTSSEWLQVYAKHP